MGERRRRKAILGNRYGTPETSKRQKQNTAISSKLKLDYGHFCVKEFGVKPIKLIIEDPVIIIGKHEAYISFMAGEFLGTIIVPPEFAKAYRQNSLQLLEVVPDPSDAYVAANGDRVCPFKLVSQN